MSHRMAKPNNYFMTNIYQILLKKVIIDSDNQYSELNLDWIYSNYEEAEKQFNELVKDEALHIASLKHIKINNEIVFVRVESGKITKLQRLTLSN